MTRILHNPFEELLIKHEQNTRPLPKRIPPAPLKASNNASLDDFISMLAEVCSNALKPWQAELNPNEGAILKDDDKELEHPVILYELVNRIPKLERKPRLLETIIEETDDEGNKRLGRTWSQRFSCVIQFNVVASDYLTANAVMNTLEDTIFTYSGYFKSKGVAELVFKRHFTDRNYDRYRQWLSVRSLQYDIEIEKLTTVFDTTIESISI